MTGVQTCALPIFRVVAIAAKIVKPRRINRKANVTIKLGNPVFTTSQPLKAPIAMQRTKVNIIANQTGQPKVTESSAIDMPAKPIMDPTERSNSPAIINIQAPTAIIVNCADTTDQFIIPAGENIDRKSTRLNSSHVVISYAVFCLKKKKIQTKILL